MSVGYQDIGTAKHCGRNQFVQTCGSRVRIEQQSWCHLCTTLSNLLLLISFFTSSKVKLVNIRSEDIVDGSPKLTLGLIWTIILYYQVSCSLFSGFSRQFKEDEGKFNQVSIGQIEGCLHVELGMEGRILSFHWKPALM